MLKVGTLGKCQTRAPESSAEACPKFYKWYYKKTDLVSSQVAGGCGSVTRERGEHEHQPAARTDYRAQGSVPNAGRPHPLLHSERISPLHFVAEGQIREGGPAATCVQVGLLLGVARLNRRSKPMVREVHRDDPDLIKAFQSSAVDYCLAPPCNNFTESLQ
jgi:hypothetical protein